jgi:hypothetical protein
LWAAQVQGFGLIDPLVRHERILNVGDCFGLVAPSDERGNFDGRLALSEQVVDDERIVLRLGE